MANAPSLTSYTVTWSTLPQSLRYYLISSALKSRFPLYLLSFFLASAIRGGRAPSFLTALALSASCHYLQECAAYVASVIVMAGSNETYNFYMWLALSSESSSSPTTPSVAAGGGGEGAGAVPSVSSHRYSWFQRLLPSYLHRIFPDLPRGLSSVIGQGRMIRSMLPSLREAEMSSEKGGKRITINLPSSLFIDNHGNDSLDGMIYNLNALMERVNGQKSWDAYLRALVIYFGGNGELYEFRADLSTWGKRYGLAVLMVNYKGYGESSGNCTRAGTILDCAAIITYATKCLGVPSERIILLGHSIGGAIATETARFFPSSLLINDRSFSSLSSIARHMMLPKSLWLPSESKWARIANKTFELIIQYIACYEMQVTDYLSLLNEKNKVVVYHKDDGVIIAPSQLYLQVNETSTAVIRMNGEKNNAHNREFNSTEMTSVLTVVAKFLKGHSLLV